MTVYYADSDATGTPDGLAWATAWNTADLVEAFLEGTFADGDILYIQGSFTETASSWDCSTRDGAAIGPRTIIGVKNGTTAEPPVYADWGTPADRPTIALGAYVFKTGDYWKIFNLEITATSDEILSLGAYSVCYNCKITVTSASARVCFLLNGYNTCISCEATGSGGGAHVGFKNYAANMVLFCFVHDIATGILHASAGGFDAFNSLDTLTTGVSVNSRLSIINLNNSFNDCTTSISGSTGTTISINNIFGGQGTDGALWTTQSDASFFWANHVYEHADHIVDAWDLVAATLPHGDVPWVTTPSSGDALFTAANDDCSLQASSPCIDAGLALTLGVG